MLRVLLGVALGATFATVFNHVRSEREKQQLVDELTRIYEEKPRRKYGGH